MSKTALDILAAGAGIERDYCDQFGIWRRVPDEVVLEIAATMDSGIRSAEGAPQLQLDPVSLAIGAPVLSVLVSTPTEVQLRWQVIDDANHGLRTGGQLIPSSSDAATPNCRSVALPELSVGYHRVRVSADGFPSAESLIVVPPPRAFAPAWLGEGRGVWGIAIQLYSLRRRGDWGIGDFSALSAFVRLAAAAGAATVGLNPLHALYLDDPERASPYSPSSRFYLNPLYIDVEAVCDFNEAKDRDTVLSSSHSRIEKLGAENLIDYRAVAALKRDGLACAYRHFLEDHRGKGTSRDRAFEEFLRAEGPLLQDYCRFVALREHFGAEDVERRDWRRWPSPFRDPNGVEVGRFAASHASEIEFVAYMQWIAAGQFAEAAAAAKDAGMSLGLYRDLAVGVDPAGADAWTQQRTLVNGWSVGAPPDSWNRLGQKWGLVPLSPVAMRRSAYRDFIGLARSNMCNAGILRIDHVLGLWRAFWIRDQDPPERGAYVRYPFDELAAILAIESQSARCIVVGEDLGTLPEGLHEALRRWGILSTRLLYFEQDGHGNSRPAAEYEREALAAVGTHDLPPFAAYWTGEDLALKSRLGQLEDGAVLAGEQARRERERGSIGAMIGARNSEGRGEHPVLAAYRFLAGTPSRIVMVQIEDALGLAQQINLPGTTDSYPNWRHRLPVTVNGIFEHPLAQSLFSTMRDLRPLPLRGG